MNRKRTRALFLAAAVLAGGISVQASQDMETEWMTDVMEAAVEVYPGTESDASEEAENKSLRFAESWADIYQALSGAKNYYPYYEEVYMVEDAAAEMSVNATADTAAVQTKQTASTDYSTTNLRDAAVDEADIVKTDGKYIYFIKDGAALVIVEAGAEESALASISQIGQSYRAADLRELELDESSGISGVIDLVGYETGTYITPQEMYVDGDTLVLIRSLEKPNYLSDKRFWYSSYETDTVVETYDISDRTRPVLLGSITQQGTYMQSRKSGDILYLYTTDSPYLEDIADESSLGVTVNGEELTPDQFCIPDLVTDTAYLIISSVSVKEPSAVIDHKVYVSGAENCYATTDNLYVMTSYYNYSGSSSKTEIASFDTRDGLITGRAAVTIRGYVNDTWSIDAHNGYLRVLTTYTGATKAGLVEALGSLESLEDIFDWYDSQTWVRHNALLVFDENLHRIGGLYDLAKNEEVRSARFFGDTAYFVTYENTDPVFCVDLSDPADPVVLSELKVSGFSSYLHPYGEGKLLGIGYETDEDTGDTLGLKLSMFDISRPGEVTEITREVIPGITWAPAIADYKSIFVNAGKNLIGFYYDERYYIYSYDEQAGFTRQILYDYYGDDLGGTTTYNGVRGLYIGEELYLAGGNSVIGFDMSNGFAQNLTLRVLPQA